MPAALVRRRLSARSARRSNNPQPTAAARKARSPQARSPCPIGDLGALPAARPGLFRAGLGRHATVRLWRLRRSTAAPLAIRPGCWAARRLLSTWAPALVTGRATRHNRPPAAGTRAWRHSVPGPEPRRPPVRAPAERPEPHQGVAPSRSPHETTEIRQAPDSSADHTISDLPNPVRENRDSSFLRRHKGLAKLGNLKIAKRPGRRALGSSENESHFFGASTPPGRGTRRRTPGCSLTARR
jgi:hypothetical protein